MEPAYFLVETSDLNSPVFNIKGTEAHHALRVRRVREKEKLVVTDGFGLVGEVEVLALGPGDQVTVKVVDKKTKVKKKVANGIPPETYTSIRPLTSPISPNRASRT